MPWGIDTLHYFLPEVNYYWWGIIITVIFILVNLVGVIFTSRTQSVLGLIMWSALLAVPIVVFTSGKVNISYWHVLKESISMSDWMTVTFFVVMWLYYVWWKSHNKKKGIDIVAEAEKYESLPADWE